MFDRQTCVRVSTVEIELESFKVTKEMGKEKIEAEDEKKFRCTSSRISVKLKHWHFTGNKLIDKLKKL